MSICFRITGFFGGKDRRSAGSAVGGYMDLTPTEMADQNGVYAEAIDYALNNRNIKNIALSGPYGSGKSSIIKTFQKNNKRYKFLNISLASFKEGSIDRKLSGGGGLSDEKARLIEKSILQQMLYGGDEDRLIYSRFRKIRVPKFPIIKSFIFVISVIASTLVYKHFGEIIFHQRYSGFWILAILSASTLVGLIVVFVADIYRLSFGINMKRVSLKNAEFEACEVPSDSILNRHLDEIIYFFQSTNYDVVVIEDLDRFEDPEIFVKLREINKLINDNGKTNGNIRFLYALKDGMFVHKNRAKFFDFIIPIVPVVNSYNSRDLIKRRLSQVAITGSVEDQLIKEVSFFIDDLRLIHNTVNEFIVYYNNLSSESLDATKLFSMLIYKNVYPEDFEDLHYSRGVFHELINKKSFFSQEIRSSIQDKIVSLEHEISAIADENMLSVDELSSAYLGLIQNNAPGLITHIHDGDSFVESSNKEKLSEVFSDPPSGQILLMIMNGRQSQQARIDKSFGEIDRMFFDGFRKRKSRLEVKKGVRLAKLYEDLKFEKIAMEKVDVASLSELLSSQSDKVPALLGREDVGEFGLLLYLTQNGYIDDSYYLYISAFYEGRITAKDRDYILKIRASQFHDFDLELDNPGEVIENLRRSDFHGPYVQNVSLFDFLLSGQEDAKDILDAAFLYISRNMQRSEDFIRKYLDSGKNVGQFIITLTRFSEDGFLEISSGDVRRKFALEVLLNLEGRYISEKLNKSMKFTRYLSSSNVLLWMLDGESFSDEEFSSLSILNVRIDDLSILSALPEEKIYPVYKNNLYEINYNNILFLVDRYVSHDESVFPWSYSKIGSFIEEPIYLNILNNIEEYVSDIFIPSLAEGSVGGDDALRILIEPTLSRERKLDVIRAGGFCVSTISEIADDLWSELTRSAAICPSWQNVYLLFSRGNVEASVVGGLLSESGFSEALILDSIESMPDDSVREVRGYIYECEFIEEEEYLKIIANFESNEFPYFPSWSSTELNFKISLLGIVRLSNKSFESASKSNEIICSLIKSNIAVYVDRSSEFPVDNSILYKVISGSLSINEKISVLLTVDLSKIHEDMDSEVSDIILSILSASDDASALPVALVSRAIVLSSDRDIVFSGLNRIVRFWDREDVFSILSGLGYPYRDIAQYGKRPKLRKTKQNIELAYSLQSRGFVSSVSVGVRNIRINTRRA